MKLATVAVAALGSMIVAKSARADDSTQPTAKTDPHFSSKVDRQIDQTVGAGDSTASDLDARIKDLDETRSAIDQKRSSPVSLSVSGWVSQEVQYNK